ncbi:hypothetical protein ACRRTK_002530 [Alexandromys fortis]
MNIHHSTYRHLYNHNKIVLPSYIQTEEGSIVVVVVAVAVAVVDFLDFRFCFFIVMRFFFFFNAARFKISGKKVTQSHGDPGECQSRSP